MLRTVHPVRVAPQSVMPEQSSDVRIEVPAAGSAVTSTKASPFTAPAFTAGTTGREIEKRREVAIDANAPIPVDRKGRDALLNAMVAAPPDKANPFRSAKARRHRARLIVQGQAYRQAEQARTAKPAFAWDAQRPASAEQTQREPALA